VIGLNSTLKSVLLAAAAVQAEGLITLLVALAVVAAVHFLL